MPLSAPLRQRPSCRDASLTVVILTRDEAARLPRCLAAIPLRYAVLVLDSGSTDNTMELAAALGCETRSNSWPGFAAQRNFALRSCGIESPWVLFVDADEIYPEAFFAWFQNQAIHADDFTVGMVSCTLMFRGRPLRHAPGYPIYHPRLVRRTVQFVPNHLGHGETVEDGARLTFIDIPYDHYFYDGNLVAWMRKHVGLAEQEAQASEHPRGTSTTRSRISRLSPRMPLRPVWRFLYHFVLSRGFLDGKAGLDYSLMYAWHEASRSLIRVADPATTEIGVVATHVSPARGYGGIAEATARLVAALAAKGVSVALCVSDGSTGPRLKPGQISLAAVATLRLYKTWLFPRWGFGPGAPLAIAATILSSRTIYISGIATWPTSLAALLCRLLRKPYVVAPRGGLMPDHVSWIKRHKPHKWAFYHLVTFPGLRGAKALHATSPQEAEGIRRLLPSPPVQVIPNGIDLEEFPFHPSPPARKGTTLCYVGRLSPEKGIRRFLELWLDTHGAHDRFVIVGDGDGAYAEDVRRLAERSEGSIALRGYTDRHGVIAAITESDFLVLPSGIEGHGLRENFGNTIAEAFALARPAMVPSTLEWASAQDCVLSFGSGDADIRAAIRSAIAMPCEDRARMGAAARVWAEHHLDIKGTTGRLLALLRA